MLPGMVFAQETANDPIFNAKTRTQIPFVVNGENFTFSYAPEQDKVFVMTPASSLIVKNHQCNTNQIFMVCIDGVDQLNITNRTYFDYEVTAKIYQLKKSLEVKGTLSKSEIYPGQEIGLQFSIRNPNSYEAKDVYFVQSLDKFEVITHHFCGTEGNSLFWKGNLQPYSSISCNATLKGLVPGYHILVSNITFYNVFFKDSKNPVIGNTTVHPKQLLFFINHTNISEINVPYKILFGLQNLHGTETIETQTDFDFPRSVEVIEPKEGADNELHTFSYAAKIPPNLSIRKELVVSANAPGIIPIKYNLNYRLTEKDISDSQYDISFWKVREPKPLVQFGIETEKIEPGKDFVFVVKISNPADFKYFYDISAILKVEENEKSEGSVTNLKPKESYSIVTSRIRVPFNASVLASMNNSIRVNLSYDYLIDGQKKSLFFSLIVGIPEKRIVFLSEKVTVVSLSSSKTAGTGINTSIEQFTRNKTIVLENPYEFNSSQRQINYSKLPEQNESAVRNETTENQDKISEYETEGGFLSGKRLMYILVGIGAVTLLVIMGGLFYFSRKKNDGFQQN